MSETVVEPQQDSKLNDVVLEYFGHDPSEYEEYKNNLSSETPPVPPDIVQALAEINDKIQQLQSGLQAISAERDTLKIENEQLKQQLKQAGSSLSPETPSKSEPAKPKKDDPAIVKTQTPEGATLSDKNWKVGQVYEKDGEQYVKLVNNPPNPMSPPPKEMEVPLTTYQQWQDKESAPPPPSSKSLKEKFFEAPTKAAIFVQNKKEELQEKKGSKLPAFIVGGALGAMAVWLMMKNGDDGGLNEFSANLDTSLDEFRDDIRGELGLESNGSGTNMQDNNFEQGGRYTDFYNTDPASGSSRTGVQLPKELELVEDSTGTHSIKDNSGRTIIEHATTDRQGNLSVDTKEQLRQKGYELFQGKLGNRFMTLVYKNS